MKSDDFQSYEEVSTAFANPDMPYVVVGEEAYVVEGGRLPASITLRVALIPKQYDHFPQKITLKEGEETYVYNNTIHTRYAQQVENAHFVQNIACQWIGEGSQIVSGISVPLHEGLLKISPRDVVYDKPFSLWPKDIHETRVFDEENQAWCLIPYKITDSDVYFPIGGVYVKNLPFSTVEACYGRVSITDDTASLIAMTHSEFIAQETPVPLKGSLEPVYIDIKKDRKIYMMSHANEGESLSLRGALCKGFAKIVCMDGGETVTYRSHGAYHASEDYGLLDITFVPVKEDM